MRLRFRRTLVLWPSGRLSGSYPRLKPGEIACGWFAGLKPGASAVAPLGSGAKARDGEGADFPGLKAGAFTVVLLRSTLGSEGCGAKRREIDIAEHSAVWVPGLKPAMGRALISPASKAGAFTVVLLRSTLGSERLWR
ncbi:MAG TPA: hypothetical protein VL990_09690 [Acidobacteriaceae bacterium]|nr:hypothetical protein [Acidobacteriaceae bacterium]